MIAMKVSLKGLNLMLKQRTTAPILLSRFNKIKAKRNKSKKRSLDNLEKVGIFCRPIPSCLLIGTVINNNHASDCPMPIPPTNLPGLVLRELVLVNPYKKFIKNMDHFLSKKIKANQECPLNKQISNQIAINSKPSLKKEFRCIDGSITVK